MQFEVPQFIDVEDKIFGPLSWRQFLYVGGGVGMGVAIFLTAPLFIFILFGLPIAVLAVALAFYPINNRPFSFFLEAFFTYFQKQRLYLWKSKDAVVHRDRRPKDRVAEVLTEDPQFYSRKRGRGINDLARQLELQTLQKDK